MQKTHKYEIVHIEVSALIPYARNSRTHSPEQVKQIAASIREFGFTNPVLISPDKTIIAGHGRVQAATHLQMDTVPCIVLSDLTDTQRRAYVLADNKLALNADWDLDMLKIELDALHEDGFDVGLTGFDPDELLEAMGLNDIQPIIDDEIPEPPEVPVTQKGDLWIMDGHRLLCGDSTKAEDVRRLMDGAISDVLITSPPYGLGESSKIRDNISSKSSRPIYDDYDDNPDAWGDLMRMWYSSYREHVSCIICNVQLLANNKRQLVHWLDGVSSNLCDVIIWDKKHGPPQIARNVLTNRFEFCFIFNESGSRSIPFADFHGNVSNVIDDVGIGKNAYADVHRAVYPVDLPLWFLRNIFPRCKSVCDPFMGTGTTLIAAEQLGLKCYGMELSCQYCDVIVNRWETLTGKKAIRING